MSYVSLFEQLKDIYQVPEGGGFVDTYMDNVRFFWSTESVERAPLLYNRGIIIVGQGHKVAYIDDRQLRYDANHYLICSVPSTIECETHASVEYPVFGIFVDIDVSRLNAMIEKVEKHLPENTFKGQDIYCGVEPVKVDAQLQQVIEKLLTCLQSTLDSDVLGQSLVDEIIYRALLGEHGQALVALTQQDSHYSRVAHSLTHIHENYMDNLAVDQLAVKANMSVSSFHRAFKAVTGESPLQYIKKVRLNKARFLIMRDGLRVSSAALEVGYESVSQFSREFKRYFQVPPSCAQDGAYAAVYRS